MMVQRFSEGQQLNVGVVGATGLVGSMMRELLAERNFPVGTLRLFASARSAGKVVDFKGTPVTVEDAETADYAGLDVVFFSAGGSTSKALAPKVAAAGAVVIDNSSAWRSDPEVPLVVAEVNPAALANLPKGIVANPNCTTMAVMPVLKPLHDEAGLKRLVASTYQAVSGAGVAGIEILAKQLTHVGDRAAELARNGQADFLPAAEKWAAPIAHNIAPLNYVLGEDDYTEEELKLRDESRKILNISTPLLKGTSKIQARFLLGDQRYYFVCCVKCGHSQSLRWRRTGSNGEVSGIVVVNNPGQNDRDIVNVAAKMTYEGDGFSATSITSTNISWTPS